MQGSAGRVAYVVRAAVIVAFATALASLASGTTPGVAAPGVPSPPDSPPVTTPDTRPNVVVVLTDDQRRDTLPHMPSVQRLLVAQGTQYTQAMVPTSLCCPSRATVLTGMYSHSMRFYGNGDVGGPSRGGWRRFHRRGLEDRTMAVALQREGYRTALVGKYLNYFGKHAPPGYEPPGWDTFSALMSNHGSYYNYRLSDGSVHGSAPEDYSTDVFAAKATEFIRATPADQPLFLYFAPYGPHAPYTPAPRHDDSMSGLLPDYTAPTLQQQLRTMPRWMRERRHFTKAEVDLTRRKQQEALLSVDEAVGLIHQALQDTGRDRNTLYVFLSDNGYFWGEHRSIGKDSPYKDSTDIPMVVRWDGHVPAGAVDDRIVLNVDVARTVAEATGATMRTDGLGMFGPTTRKGVVLEAMAGYHNRPAYCGWRTKNRMFVRWATGERELFDYRVDPDERRNLAGEPGWAEVRRKMRANAIRACSRVPPGYDW